MTFEEFAKADSDKLTEMAKACFDNSQEMAGGAWERRVAKLLEAQFYVIYAVCRPTENQPRRESVSTAESVFGRLRAIRLRRLLPRRTSRRVLANLVLRTCEQWLPHKRFRQDILDRPEAIHDSSFWPDSTMHVIRTDPFLFPGNRWPTAPPTASRSLEPPYIYPDTARL